MELSVNTQQLQVECAFVFGYASDGFAVAQVHCDCPIRGSATRPAAAVSWLRTTGIDQRPFDLGQCLLVSHIRKIGTQHTAAPPHRVAKGAAPLACEERLACK